MGLQPIAWRGDQGQSPGDTAALPQSQSLRSSGSFALGSLTFVTPRSARITRDNSYRVLLSRFAQRL